jgi:hypothetical protein
VLSDLGVTAVAFVAAVADSQAFGRMDALGAHAVVPVSSHFDRLAAALVVTDAVAVIVAVVVVAGAVAVHQAAQVSWIDR